jgi:hypothetical protein
MAESSRITRLSELRLSVEDREQVAQAVRELIAVNVYRELQRVNDVARVSGCAIIGNCSNGSCNIIGNCSSSALN